MASMNELIDIIHDKIINEESVKDITSCVAFSSRLRETLRKMISNDSLKNVLFNTDNCTINVSFDNGKIVLIQSCNLPNYEDEFHKCYECNRKITFSLCCIDGVDYLVIEEQFVDGKNNKFDDTKQCFVTKKIKLFYAKEVNYFVGSTHFLGYKKLHNSSIPINSVVNNIPSDINIQSIFNTKDKSLSDYYDVTNKFDSCKFITAQRSVAGGTIVEYQSEFKKGEQINFAYYEDSKNIYGVNAVGDGYTNLIATLDCHKYGINKDGMFDDKLIFPIVYRIDVNGKPLPLNEAISEVEILYQRSFESLKDVIKWQKSNNGNSIIL